jgi:hypothetical protein
VWFNSITVADLQDDRPSLSIRNELGNRLISGDPSGMIGLLPYVLLKLVWFIQHPEQKMGDLSFLNLIEVRNSFG